MSSAASSTVISVARFGALIFTSWMYVYVGASNSAANQRSTVSTPIDPVVFESYGEKVLLFGSDIADAVMKAREEAMKQNVNLDKMTRYIVVFDKDNLRVGLAPPYEGGLDGPEFRVVFRRSDLKVLRLENKLH